MTWSRRTWLGAVTSMLAGASAPADTVAFHYAAIFPPDALRWYKRFRLLVTGAVLSSEQSKALRENGPKLVAYEWSTGLYAGEPASHRSWEASVRANRSWLLASNPSGGGSAAAGRTAWWYDFGNPEFRRQRAKWLADLLDRSQYDGLFFDTVGSEQLPPAMLAAFQQRWPGEDYNASQGEFFAELRRLAGNRKLIFLNQGYRHAAHLLPHADLDLTESYFTAIEGERTRFRSWNDPQTPWESIRLPMEQLVIPAGQKFPKVRFVHVNYATPDAADRAARYAWAVSRLWNHTGYTMVPGNAGSERDPLYFSETGAPTSDRWEQDGPVVFRSFEGGIVAINTSDRPAVIGRTRTAVPAGPDGFFFPAAKA